MTQLTCQVRAMILTLYCRARPQPLYVYAPGVGLLCVGGGGAGGVTELVLVTGHNRAC